MPGLASETWERPANSLVVPPVKSQPSEVGLDGAFIDFMDKDQADMLLMNSLKWFRRVQKLSLSNRISAVSWNSEADLVAIVPSKDSSGTSVVKLWPGWGTVIGTLSEQSPPLLM